MSALTEHNDREGFETVDCGVWDQPPARPDSIGPEDGRVGSG